MHIEHIECISCTCALPVSLTCGQLFGVITSSCEPALVGYCTSWIPLTNIIINTIKLWSSKLFAMQGCSIITLLVSTVPIPQKPLWDCSVLLWGNTHEHTHTHTHTHTHIPNRSIMASLLYTAFSMSWIIFSRWRISWSLSHLVVELGRDTDDTQLMVPSQYHGSLPSIPASGSPPDRITGSWPIPLP